MLAPGRSDVKLTRDLDEAVRQFHQARLDDGYAYLFLDRVSLRVRRPAGSASYVPRPTAGPRPELPFALSGHAGGGSTAAWCGGWNETCRNCSPSSPSSATCGASYAPPT